MASYTVTAEKLEDLAKQIGTKSKNLSSNKNNLINCAKSIDAAWDGGASEQFLRKFRAESNKIDKFVNDLEKYSSVLKDIANDYRNTEKTNTENANSAQGI